MNLPEYIATFPKPRISNNRLEHIRQLKRDNPTASVNELAWLSFDSKFAVMKAIKGE